MKSLAVTSMITILVYLPRHRVPSATVPQPNRNISRKGAKAAKKTLCHFDQREKSFLDRRERK